MDNKRPRPMRLDATSCAKISHPVSPTQAGNSKDPDWVDKRSRSIVVRKGFTQVLQAHGVMDWGYGKCTNEIYTNILGAKKKDICERRGLGKSTNLKDVMTAEELTVISMAEMVAAKQIDKSNVRGNYKCAEACGAAAKGVAALLA